MPSAPTRTSARWGSSSSAERATSAPPGVCSSGHQASEVEGPPSPAILLASSRDCPLAPALPTVGPGSTVSPTRPPKFLTSAPGSYLVPGRSSRHVWQTQCSGCVWVLYPEDAAPHPAFVSLAARERPWARERHARGAHPPPAARIRGGGTQAPGPVVEAGNSQTLITFGRKLEICFLWATRRCVLGFKTCSQGFSLLTVASDHIAQRARPLPAPSMCSVKCQARGKKARKGRLARGRGGCRQPHTNLGTSTRDLR